MMSCRQACVSEWQWLSLCEEKFKQYSIWKVFDSSFQTMSLLPVSQAWDLYWKSHLSPLRHGQRLHVFVLFGCVISNTWLTEHTTLCHPSYRIVFFVPSVSHSFFSQFSKKKKKSVYLLLCVFWFVTLWQLLKKFEERNEYQHSFKTHLNLKTMT